MIATQDPRDLDYRTLPNAGLWCIGRLQTEADRDRVLDGLSVATTTDSDPKEMEHTIARLAPRWFVVRNVHAAEAAPILVKPRNTWSRMRGPLTHKELRQVLVWRNTGGAQEGAGSRIGHAEVPACELVKAKAAKES